MRIVVDRADVERAIETYLREPGNDPAEIVGVRPEHSACFRCGRTSVAASCSEQMESFLRSAGTHPLGSRLSLTTRLIDRWSTQRVAGRHVGSQMFEVCARNVA